MAVDRLLDHKILGEREVDVVDHVALQVDLGGVLDTQDVGVEDPEVCRAPLRKSQPGFKILPRGGIQCLKYKSGLRILIWPLEVPFFVVRKQSLFTKVPIFETKKMALLVAKSKF